MVTYSSTNIIAATQEQVMPVEFICQICKYQETSSPLANNNGSQEMQSSVVLGVVETDYG